MDVLTVLARLEGDESGMVKAFDAADKSMDKMAGQADDSTKKAEDHYNRMEGTVSKVLGKIGGLLAAAFSARAVINFAKESIAALGAWEAVNAQTQAALTSTGAAAWASADHIHDLAQSLEGLTATQAETIQAGANMLLTFQNIQNRAGEGNDIFDQATATLVDYARATGQDASQAAIMFGKALNDPIAGLTALGRAGVQFTDQQKSQIEAMVAAGDVMGAQKIILGELQEQFGGSGAAYAATWEGTAYRLSDAWGDFGETLFAGVMPALTALANTATDALAWLTETSAVQDFGSNLVGVFTTMWSNVQPIFDSFASALGPVLAELGPQVVALLAAFSPLGTVLKALEPVAGLVANTLATVGEALSGTLAAILPTVTRLMDGLAGVLSDALAAVLPVIGTMIENVADTFDVLMPSIVLIADALGGALMTVLESVVGILPTLMDAWLSIQEALLPIIPAVLDIVMALLPLVDVAADLISAILPPLIDLFVAILGPILDLVGPLIDLLAPALKFVADVISNVVSWLFEAMGGTDAFGAVVEVIGKAVGGYFETMGAIIGAVFSGIGTVVGWIADYFTRTFDTILSVVHTVGSVFETVFGAIGGFISDAFNTALGVVKGAVNGIIGLINGVIGGINSISVDIPDWVPLIGGTHLGFNLPKIPALAEGGTLLTSGLALVGERGPELLHLPAGASVTPRNDYLEAMGGGAPVQVHIENLTVQAAPGQDAEETGEAMAEALVEELKSFVGEAAGS